MSNPLRDRAPKVFGRQHGELVPRTVGDEFVYGGDEAENSIPTPAVIPRRLALSVEASGALDLGNFRLTPTGLEIEGIVTEEQWRNVGSLIGRIDTSVQWLLGDWMAYGERTWGKTYEQVAEETGYNTKTLRNFAWVASNVVLSLRRDKLSFEHHKLVAGLSPDLQDYYLGQAEVNGWSTRQLLEIINPPALSTGGDPLAVKNFTEDAQRLGNFLSRVGDGQKLSQKQRQEAVGKIEALRRYLDEAERIVRGE